MPDFPQPAPALDDFVWPDPSATPRPPLTRVPRVPEDLLRARHCFVPGDTRFRSAARLRQSLWREAEGFPIGQHRLGDRPDGPLVPLGSRLDPETGRQGRNFVSHAVHSLVRRELALAEEGALIETERLYCNLLSSTALTFNLLGPLALEPQLATDVFRALLPGFVHAVERIRFETSPGRGDPRYLHDHSAFDAALEIITPDGEPGTVFIELKYSEGLCGPAATARPRYDEVARELDLFVDPESRVLRSRLIEQFWRLHMLAGLAVRHGVTPRALFVVIAPALNRRAQAALKVYRAELAAPPPAADAHVGFVALTLETVVKAMADAGDPISAANLTERYLDFWPVLDLVLAEDPASGPTAGYVPALPAPNPSCAP